MSQHTSAIRWRRAPHPEQPQTYSRNHIALLNGNQLVNVSASVDYKGDAGCADPEQLLVSALASCHMLFFLAIAEAQGYSVAEYTDSPSGFLEKAEDGHGMAITHIELYPQVSFSGEKIPDEAAIGRIHASAHRSCFIGKSIKARVTVNGQRSSACSTTADALGERP